MENKGSVQNKRIVPHNSGKLSTSREETLLVKQCKDSVRTNIFV